MNLPAFHYEIYVFYDFQEIFKQISPHRYNIGIGPGLYTTYFILFLQGLCRQNYCPFKKVKEFTSDPFIETYLHSADTWIDLIEAFTNHYYNIAPLKD